MLCRFMVQSMRLRNLFLTVIFPVIGLVISIPASLIAEEQPTDISIALYEQLSEEKRENLIPALDWKLLNKFYAPRGFQPVWVSEAGPLFMAGQLLLTLQSAEQEGLDAGSYHESLIERVWSDLSVSGLVRLELLLTNAFLHYIVDIRSSRIDPEMVDQLWNIPIAKADPIAIMNGLLAASNFDVALTQLPPPHPGYLRLREALADYQRLEKRGGWPTMAPGPYLRLGVNHEQVPALRNRLMMEGDLQLGPVSDENLFDTPLQFAVKRFQVRHGLKVDGVVGPATREAMSVPVTKRIEQIKLNMQRWRWLPRNLGKRYLMVNMPAYELAVMENNQMLFTMPVIVGTPERPTPVVKGGIYSVVFNPYWTLPPTIIFEDIVPRQQRDPEYLKSRGIRLFAYNTGGKEVDPSQVDWTRVDKNHFPYILRQDPGPSNPLGRIKFLFSNEYQVYLHDTPKMHYFYETSRHFSSGCIRVAEPVKLASYALGDRESGWTPEHIRRVIASGETRNEELSRSLTVYLLYWTAWVGEGGSLFFREDIYEQDASASFCGVRSLPIEK